MVKYYELTDPQNRLYFAQEIEDGTLLALEATDLGDAVVEVVAMGDFEGDVELCAMQEGINADDAYEVVYERLRESVVYFTPQEVLEMVEEGNSHPIAAGWVIEVEIKTANCVEVKPKGGKTAKGKADIKPKAAVKPAKTTKPAAKPAAPKATAKPAGKAAAKTAASKTAKPAAPKAAAKPAGKAAAKTAKPAAKPAAGKSAKTTGKAGKPATKSKATASKAAAKPAAKTGKAAPKPAPKKK